MLAAKMAVRSVQLRLDSGRLANARTRSALLEIAADFRRTSGSTRRLPTACIPTCSPATWARRAPMAPA